MFRHLHHSTSKRAICGIGLTFSTSDLEGLDSHSKQATWKDFHSKRVIWKDFHSKRDVEEISFSTSDLEEFSF